MRIARRSCPSFVRRAGAGEGAGVATLLSVRCRAVLLSVLAIFLLPNAPALQDRAGLFKQVVTSSSVACGNSRTKTDARTAAASRATTSSPAAVPSVSGLQPHGHRSAPELLPDRPHAALWSAFATRHPQITMRPRTLTAVRSPRTSLAADHIVLFPRDTGRSSGTVMPPSGSCPDAGPLAIAPSHIPHALQPSLRTTNRPAASALVLPSSHCHAARGHHHIRSGAGLDYAAIGRPIAPRFPPFAESPCVRHTGSPHAP